MKTLLTATLLIAVLGICGCESLDTNEPLTPAARPEGKAALRGNKISTDATGRVTIYLLALDQQPLPSPTSGSSLRKISYLAPGKHSIDLYVYRDMGWSFAPFEAKVSLSFEAKPDTDYLPTIALPDLQTYKKPQTQGLLWLVDAKTGEQASEKTKFESTGFRHVMYGPY